MAIYRVFSDADGESHIGDLSLAGAGLGKRMPEVRGQCGGRDGDNGGQQEEIMLATRPHEVNLDDRP